MPTFDDLLGAVRDDCDATNLAGSAELRRLGSRRTTAHRALGGTAVLVVAGGIATGVAFYGPGTAPSAQPGASQPAQYTTTFALPSTLPSIWDSIGKCSAAPATNAATCTSTTPPATSPTAKVSPSGSSPASPGGGTNTTSGTGSNACAVKDFDVAGATFQQDDASGIVGFDITIKYTGTKSCKLTQSSTISYLSGGKRVSIPLSGSAPGLTVKPHSHITTSVFGPNDQAINPTPPECAQPHVYAGLDARIDGGQASLGTHTITLPCGGAKALPWSVS